MKPELQKIYDSVPEDEPRSRLEPYRELILLWRRQGRTYRRIRELLAETCGVKVADMTLHEFVQKRSRRRKVEPEPEIEQPRFTPAEPQRSQRAAESPGNDQYAEVRERMRKFKAEPLAKKPEPIFPVFTDDELLEPHVCNPKEKEKN